MSDPGKKKRHTGTPLGRRHIARLLLLAVGISLAAGLVFCVWSVMGPVDHGDSVLTQSEMPQNYVGAGKCAECHADQARAHATNGHSRTFARMSETDIAERLDLKSWRDPERDYEFKYEKRGTELYVRIPENHGSLELPLEYAFGSGQHSTGFVTLMADQQNGKTVALEHRVLLTKSDGFTIAPGHSQAVSTKAAEDFGMIREPIDTRACFDCHTTVANYWQGEIHGLIGNVECEKCHGPGQSHVDVMEGVADTESSEFRRRFETSADEINLCGRCHRLPEFVEPGEITPTNTEIVRFQPVGLMQSRCFSMSNGQLRCTTCHAPHASATLTTTPEYNNTCRSCHTQPDSVECPVSSPETCTSCHMPKVEVLPGMVLSDHWIRVPAAGADAESDPAVPHHHARDSQE